MNETASCSILWPSAVPCSGHGECINGRCVCSYPWVDRADFMFANGTDCVTHVTARLSLMWLAWILNGLCIILLTYGFWRLGSWRLGGHKKGMNATANLLSRRRRGGQVLNMIMFFNSFVAFVTSTVCLFVGMYIRENIGLSIVFIFFTNGQLGLTAYQARSWTRLAASVASDVEFRRRLSKIVRGIDIFLVLQAVILMGIIAICSIGVTVIGDFQVQQIMFRVGMLAHAGALFIGFVIYVKFSQTVIHELQLHLESAKSVYRNSRGGERAQVGVFEDVLESLLTSRVRLIIIYAGVVLVETLAGVFILGSSYISWIVMIVGPISYMIRVRRDILPLAASLHNGGGGATSSSDVAISGSHSAGTGVSSDKVLLVSSHSNDVE